MAARPLDHDATNILNNLAARTAHSNSYSPPLRSNTLDSIDEQGDLGYDPIDPYLATFTQKPYRPAGIYGKLPAPTELRNESSTITVPSPYPSSAAKPGTGEGFRGLITSSNFTVPNAFSAPPPTFQKGSVPPQRTGSYDTYKSEEYEPNSMTAWVPSSYPTLPSPSMPPGLEKGMKSDRAAVPNPYMAPPGSSYGKGYSTPAPGSSAASNVQKSTTTPQFRSESTTIPIPSAYSTSPVPQQADEQEFYGPPSSNGQGITVPGKATSSNGSWDGSIIDITFASMKAADPGVPDSDHFLSFSNLPLRHWNGSEFTERLRTENEESDPGLMMIIIEGWRPWFLQDFRGALPEFPLESLLYFGAEGGPAMLPLVDNEQKELSCVVEHINTYQSIERPQEGKNLLDLGITKAHRQPLVLWTRQQGRITAHGYQPVVVMIGGAGDNLGRNMRQHYSDFGNKRWFRLESDLNWSYLDTYFVLTKWDRIWSAIKENMRMRSAELQGQVPAPPILQQTRRLHQETNMIISLREHLRIHKASVRRIIQGVGDKTEATDPEARKLGRALRVRLDDTFQLLEYYDVTASSLLDQQQNLLSLAFNTETVSQGQAVTRLNALAFIFLPLSFSASIWGITTFTIDAIWYPAFALPLLVITILTALIANAIFAKRDSRPLNSNVLKTPTVQRSSIWGTIDFSKFWPRPTNGRSNRGYAPQSTNDLENVQAQGSTWSLVPSIQLQSPPSAGIPYGMSPAYGLGSPLAVDPDIRPPVPSRVNTGPLHLGHHSTTANSTGLSVPVERSGSVRSLRSQRSFSWKKGDDDLGSHPVIQEHAPRGPAPEPTAISTTAPGPSPAPNPAPVPAAPKITPATPIDPPTSATIPVPPPAITSTTAPTSLLTATYPRRTHTTRINAIPPMDHSTLETILEQSTPLARNAPSGNLAHFGEDIIDRGKRKGKEKEIDNENVNEKKFEKEKEGDSKRDIDVEDKEMKEVRADERGKGKPEQNPRFEDGTGLFYSDFWAVGEPSPQVSATGKSVEESEDEKRGFLDWKLS